VRARFRNRRRRVCPTIVQLVQGLTDDDDLRRKGKVDEAAGRVKGAIDKVKNKITGR
jgi:IS5 family transposase